MPVSFGSGVSRSFVQPDIFRGDTEPQTPNLGDLWVDLSGVTPDLKQCTDLSPLTWTSVGGGGPSGNYLEVLTANRDYYVRTDGSDSNDGLSDTPGGAFLTIQHALNVATTLYRNEYYPTIHVADGTYPESLWVTDSLACGNLNFELLGNAANPGNVIISGSYCGFNVTGWYRVIGFTLPDTWCYFASGGQIFNNIIKALGVYDSLLVDVEDCEFIGGSVWQNSAIEVFGNSYVSIGGASSVSGSPTFSDGFLHLKHLSFCKIKASITGSFTGPKVQIHNTSHLTTGSLTYIVSGTGVLLENGGRIEDVAGDYPTIGITVDGGGSELTTGTKGYIVCNKAGIINRWDIIADQSGSIVMDVWKAANPSIPTNANSITGTEKPTLTAAQIASDTSLSTWTTTVAVGDVFGFEIESVSTITRVTLTIGMV